MPTNKKPEIVGGQKKAVASAKGKVELNTSSDKKSGGKNELPNKTTTDATANKKGGGEMHKKKLRVAAQVTQASTKIRRKSNKSKTSELSMDSMEFSEDFYSDDGDSVFGSGQDDDYNSDDETVTVDEREAAAKAAKAAATDIGGDPSALAINIKEIRK